MQHVKISIFESLFLQISVVYGSNGRQIGLSGGTAILAIALVTSSGHLFGPQIWNKSGFEDIQKLCQEREFPDKCALLLFIRPKNP